jgi:hypothetical protein
LTMGLQTLKVAVMPQTKATAVLPSLVLDSMMEQSNLGRKIVTELNWVG